MRENPGAGFVGLQPFFGGVIPSLTITARVRLSETALSTIRNAIASKGNQLSDAGATKLTVDHGGFVILFLSPPVRPDQDGLAEVEFQTYSTKSAEIELPDEVVEHYGELLAMLSVEVPGRVLFECKSTMELPLSGFATKYPLPRKIWRTNDLPVGDLIGARFSLRKRGVSDAWIGFDIQGDRLNVQTYYRKRALMSDVIVAQVWRDFSLFHADTIEIVEGGLLG